MGFGPIDFVLFSNYIFSVLGYVSSAVICSNYPRGGGDGVNGYYVRPIPKHCHARHLGRWRPTFRIVRYIISINI